MRWGVLYVVTEICWISGRDGDALVEDVLVLQMRQPVFFPSAWQGWISVGVHRMDVEVCIIVCFWNDFERRKPNGLWV